MQSLHGFLVGGHPAALASVGRSLSRSCEQRVFVDDRIVVVVVANCGTVHPFSFLYSFCRGGGVIVVVLFFLFSRNFAPRSHPGFVPVTKYVVCPVPSQSFFWVMTCTSTMPSILSSRATASTISRRVVFFSSSSFSSKRTRTRSVPFGFSASTSGRYAMPPFFPSSSSSSSSLGERSSSALELLLHKSPRSTPSRRRQSRQSRQSPLVAQKISSSSSKRERGNTKRVSLLLERIIERLLLLWKDFIKSTDEEKIQSRNREKEGRGREGLKESKSRGC